MKKLLFIISLIVLVASCKKEPLPVLPPDTTPFYSIRGLLDGDSLVLNVGQEGIEIAQGTSLYKGVESYFGQISSPKQDIVVKFEFTRPQRPITAAGVAVFDYSALGFLVDEPGCLQFGFGSNQQQQNFVEIKNQQNDFEPATSIELDEFGIHNVDMKFSNYSQEIFSLPVKYGFDDNQLNPGFAAIAMGDSIKLGPYDQDGFHQWFVNGSLASNTPVYSSAYNIGIHLIEHRITDEFGNVSVQQTLMRVTDYVLDWKMDISSCSTAPPNNYGKIIVSIQTGDDTYYSNESPINHSNVFSASNLQFVSKQQGQEPTWAVFDFFFDATLVNQSNTDSLSLDGMTGTFNIGL